MHKNSFKEDMKLLKIGIKEVHRLTHWILPITIFDSIFKSISPFVNIYMSARIIDELFNGREIDKLTFLVAITIALNLVIHLFSTGLDHLRKRYFEIMDLNQDMRLNEKIISMDYEHVENPEVHKLRTRITESKNMNGGGINELVNRIGYLVRGLCTVITSIVLVIDLFKYNIGTGFINTRWFCYIFIAFIILCTFINLKITTISEQKEFKQYSKVMDGNRIFSFYFNQAIDYNVGKGVRLYNQKKIFNDEIKSFNKEESKLFNSIGNMKAKYNGVSAFISSLLGGMVYVFVALKAITGAITIGSIVKYAGSINQFIEGSTLVLSSINNIRNNNQYLKLYIEFLNIEGEKYKGTLPVEKRNDDEYEIEFKNVSFKYPGTDEYVLKNVSMNLNIGERLAIVGMNGSGKTTFIKLLCRLYDPNEGEILLNGINIKKYDYNEYMRLFSIVFQDFNLFSFSLGQNVAASVEFDEEIVKECVEKGGLMDRLEKMPKGINTPLYKDFDEAGVEISGGEAQKIALSRALYRDAPIIILDEPTAALDPISEFEIYSKFNEIVGSKTAFYISHRLSSCRFCDEIAVFNEGRIIQKGSHDELVKDENGKYYELWNSQAQYYNDKDIA